ncbi:small RNA 2'-O-methyltransferase isoform X2 [Betta splendens]|uniref:Small RNA 2'-O-methyltransferase n=1 Tax=Betta splendens TaxID=158456 RepID=A0A9W2XS17_BETSP|nr:small RNA 2'-O-methyltransferase isoform X2 [Betta splendens]
MFSPPLHRQRHQFVIDFVKRNKPKKVADLGCGECGLLRRLKFHREVELLVGVDVSSAKVKKKIIEHLSPADVGSFSDVVFGYMTPVVVIVSTPNSEFNPLLPGLVGYRHTDHKFEWTRAEFRSWALKVCEDYEYEVEFTGVGQAPPGQQEQFGFCSQIGVFQRLGGKHGCNTFGDGAEEMFSYTLLFSINYPSLRDNTTLQRVLVSEVLYWAEKLKSGWTDQEPERGSVSTRRQSEGAAGETHRGSPVGLFSRRVSEEQDEEVSWTNLQGQQESCTLTRCVAVPLAVLWSCCPKVRDLSGSLSNLRQLLLDEPKVKLSQDCSAVLLHYKEPDPEEEDFNVLEDSGYAEASHCSHSAQHWEDWQADL